jgi:hypothetical protein
MLVILLDTRARQWIRATKNKRTRQRITLVIFVNDVQYNDNPPTVRGREGIMEELIARLVANVGVDRVAAEKSVGIILDFLRKEGPPDKVQALIDRLPGAEALLQAQQAEAGGGGMFAMGGIMGAGTKMMAAGLSMGQVQGVTKEVIAYSREKAGEDEIGEIVGAIPGLSQFI